MTTEADIFTALTTRLAALTLSPPLPIAWPNVDFTPPAGHRYLRAVFVPNMANRVFIGSTDLHQLLGLFQVSVYWGKGEGEKAPREIAGQVAAWFSCDLKLDVGSGRLRITKRPEVRDMIVEDAAVQMPVIVSWECWA